MRKSLTLLSLFIYASMRAQVAFHGSVLSEKGNTEIPFATVCVTSVNDTVGYKVLTDLKGKFTISDLETERYRITVTSLGYMPLDTVVAVRYPSAGGLTVIRSFFLREDAKMLDDVVVTGAASVQSVDSKSYLITRNDLHNAVTGVDLLRKIPNITFDKATQTLKSHTGGNIKILVNGVSASQNDILALSAGEIKRIVCYDFPPARYAGYSVVLDFITRDRVTGFNAGLSAANAFTTGYSSDMLHLKYNNGYNQFSLVANTDYRNYRKFDTVDNYDYVIGDDSYESLTEGKRKFGYDDNHISVSFNRHIPEKYQFNVTFSPNFQHSHIDENQDNLFTVNHDAQPRTAAIYSRTRQFTPSLDIYYNVSLKNSRELTFNAVGSLIDAVKKYRKEEKNDRGAVFEDNNVQENRKYGFIGECNYTRSFRDGTTFALGNRFSYNHLRAGVESTFGNAEYKTRMLTDYSFAEMKGLWKHFMYRLSLGVSYYFNRNDETSFSSWVFQPQVLIGWKINNGLTFRMMFSRNTSIPTLSDLSNNKILVTENIVRQGNPGLKNSISNTAGLMLDYSRSWLNSQLAAGFVKERNAFNQYFVQEDGYICLKNENAKAVSAFIVRDALTFMPFPKSNLLMVKVTAAYIYSRINSGLIGTYNHDQFPVDYEVLLNYKKFHASYSGNILSWEMNAPYLKKGEKVSTLSLNYYPKENISISASVLWLGRNASYYSKTLGNSIVKNWGSTNIRDNRNMFTIGFSYRFKTGKPYRDKDRNIHNKDTDSGIN